MPQTEPMTAEAFGLTICEASIKIFLKIQADKSAGTEALFDGIRKELKPLIAQRDRDILMKAAEKFCDYCDLIPEEELCPGKVKCWRRKAILAPINEKEGS